MIPPLDILKMNCDKAPGTIIGHIIRDRTWRPSAYWQIDKALYDLAETARADESLFRDSIACAAISFSHLMLTYSWHFDSSDDWKYENLTSAQIYDWRDRVHCVFEGFFTGSMPHNEAPELSNPLLDHAG